MIDSPLAAGEAEQTLLVIDREIQRSMAHMAAIVEISDDAIIGKTLDGVIRAKPVAAEALESALQTIDGSRHLFFPAIVRPTR